VDVQTHEGRGRNHQAYLWQYSRPGGTVVFDFRLGRGRDGPREFLGQFEGILQTNGYSAYDQIGGPRIVHAACWAHGGCFLKRCNSTPATASRLRSQREWMSCFPSTRKLAANPLAFQRVMHGDRKEPGLCWRIFATRSKQRSPSHCHPVRSARLASMRSRFGKSSPGFWSIQNLN